MSLVGHVIPHIRGWDELWEFENWFFKTKSFSISNFKNIFNETFEYGRGKSIEEKYAEIKR